MGYEDEIDYSGPSRELQPGPGGAYLDTTFNFRAPSQRTYADINRLKQRLGELTQYTQNLVDRIDMDMRLYSLHIPEVDAKLWQAAKDEWPAELGSPDRKVSYRYYKALKARTTTSSDYVTQKFEEAARDVSGTDALDILALGQVILDEAILISEFIDIYLKDVDDEAEFRIVELFQDWTESAFGHAGELGSLYTKTERYGLTDSELDQIGPQTARDAQAVLKVKVNEANSTWTTEKEALFRNFAQFAPSFYGHFLGPALRFRLSIGRKLLPTDGALGAQLTSTVSQTNANLESLITDQLRRNTYFDEKMNRLKALITTRKEHKDIIEQLAVKGNPVAVGAGRFTTTAADSLAEINFFENEIASQYEYTSDATPTLKPRHSSLIGLEDADAHPQYLLRSGGHLTGHITTDPDIKIGGIVPGTHRHDGLDGSAQISGTAIAPGTLPADSIDAADEPDAPTKLRLASTERRIIPPGVTVVDATISWEAAEGLQFEVQIAPVE